DRPLQNQLMLEVLDPDDSMRYAYYSRNKEFIGIAKPLETCLTEDPIQVMLSGKVAPMREAESALRGAPFAENFALAVTSYESKDFAMIDVINPVCSKGSSLAEYIVLRSGLRLHVTGYQLVGDKYRLQITGGKLEVAAADVAAIEPEDVFTPLPAAATPAAAQPLYRDLVEAAAKRYNVDSD